MLDLDIYRDGLIIYTTLDSRLQKAAEDAINLLRLKNQLPSDFAASTVLSLID